MKAERYILIIFGLLFIIAVATTLVPRPRVDQINLHQEACEQAEKDKVSLASCYNR